MIGKKMMLWMGAGLVVSAVSIPAIGATVRHHRKLHAKPVSQGVHLTAPAAKTVSHAKKPTTLLAARTVKKQALVKVGKSQKTGIHSQFGVLAMHSGRATATPAAAKSATHKSIASHLLSATVKTKTVR